MKIFLINIRKLILLSVIIISSVLFAGINTIISVSNEGVKDIPRGVDQTLILDQVFVEAVRTGDASKIRSDYDDALKSLKMCFAAEQSIATGQVVYF